MTDLDLLPGLVAGTLRLHADVDRLYPARPSLAHPIRSLAGLLVEVDDCVAVSDDQGTTVVEVNVGLTATSARTSARDLAAAIRGAVPDDRPLRVRVRIVSVG